MAFISYKFIINTGEYMYKLNSLDQQYYKYKCTTFLQSLFGSFFTHHSKIYQNDLQTLVNNSEEQDDELRNYLKYIVSSLQQLCDNSYQNDIIILDPIKWCLIIHTRDLISDYDSYITITHANNTVNITNNKKEVEPAYSVYCLSNSVSSNNINIILSFTEDNKTNEVNDNTILDKVRCILINIISCLSP